MTMLSTHALRVLLPAALVAAIACGSNKDTNGGFTGGGDKVDASTPTAPFDNGSGFGQQAEVKSIAIDPPQATIDIVNGAITPRMFKVVATHADGSTTALSTGITWSATSFPVGAIDSAGIYRPTGQQGGVVQVKAQVKALSAAATLTVKLVLQENPGNVPGAAQTALKGATAADAAVKWAYPYDATVFPRGLASPSLMWSGGAAGDTYLVRIKSPTFELESYGATAPPERLALAQPTWEKFTESTSGTADVTVARYSGTAATVIAKHKWTISPASMAGTIYYWSNNEGRVLRIKPGAAAPEDFSAGFLTGLPASGCTMTCHTVSADGSTIVSGGDTLGGTYDLRGNRVYWDEGGDPGSAQKRRWSYGALSPNGKYLTESFAPFPVGFGTQSGLFLSANKQLIPNSGLDGVKMGTPAFAPDGSLIAFVDYENGATKDSLKVVSFDMALGKASNVRELVKKGQLADIAFPSVSPDAKWVVYQRGTGVRTDGGNTADLYIASTTTGQETRLAALNGDNYPFLAGDRDKRWNFEPTFAPVASGGYFWVVLTTRRTLGNELTAAADATKQLWVAAIDQSPTAGADPSHPAFHLPGQGKTRAGSATPSLNMRGFWSLEACKGDGIACETGAQCCGGYCDKSAAGQSGKGVCKSAPTACSQSGDRCEKTSDCCDAPAGVTCINKVCSEPTPR